VVFLHAREAMQVTQLHECNSRLGIGTRTPQERLPHTHVTLSSRSAQVLVSCAAGRVIMGGLAQGRATHGLRMLTRYIDPTPFSLNAATFVGLCKQRIAGCETTGSGRADARFPTRRARNAWVDAGVQLLGLLRLPSSSSTSTTSTADCRDGHTVQLVGKDASASSGESGRQRAHRSQAICGLFEHLLALRSLSRLSLFASPDHVMAIVADHTAAHA
jgi:hypothetical protein